VDERPSADPTPPAPEDTRARRTRNPGAVATDLTPGESREYPEVPGYEILGVCGHGGMGVVYRARQLKANRLVALKMIRAVEHASPTERLRFQIEAEAVARLQHPHVVQLYEVGEVRGQPYFSLEFCDGGTLTDQLKKQRPTPQESAQLIETLARAMHYAHLRGVVHRDLKPGNVLLAGAERVPKITDFGLAKRIDAEARDLSQSGAIMGTAAYMAPEQAAGKVRDTGPAADVYALGALLYECLAGRPPFGGPQHVVLVSVLNEEPVPPSRLGAKVPRDLETVCLKCLSKEPEKRYTSAAALADDLKRWLAGEPISARPVGQTERVWRWCRRNPALAVATGLAAAALVAVAVVSTWMAVRLDVARNQAEQARQDAVTSFEAKALAHRQEERQRRRAEGNAEHSRRLLVRQYLASGTRLLDDGDLAGSLVWFAEALKHDGKDPQRAEMHRTRLAAVLRQCPRLIQVWFHDGPPRQAAFSPDGRRVVTVAADAARVWDVQTGRLLAAFKHRGPVLSAAFVPPDDRRVVTGSADRTARVWDAATGKLLTPPLMHPGSVTASPSKDGRRLITFSRLGLFGARVWDAATGELLTPMLRGGQDVVTFSPTDHFSRHPAVNPGAHFWRLPADDRPVADWERLAQVLSSRTLDDTGGLTPLEPEGFGSAWRAMRGKYPADFERSPQEVLAWHRHAALGYATRRLWEPARWHLDKLLEGEPRLRLFRVARGMALEKRGQLHEAQADFTRAIEMSKDDGLVWAARGGVHGDLGQLDRADADLAKAVEMGVQDVSVWYAHTLLRLDRGGRRAHRAVCARLLDRFGVPDDERIAPLVARSCLLSQDAVTDWAQVIRLAGLAWSYDAKQHLTNQHLGAAYFRAGKLGEALKHLKLAVEKHGAGGKVFDWLFLAMTYQRLNEAGEGKKWLDKAASWIDRGAPSLHWAERLEARILRREAEQLLKKAAQPKK
jgi:tetratricopeptide (TPR) repeat protein/tRNA A-37 threonylcarbamoyl transferase component Bud32